MLHRENVIRNGDLAHVVPSVFRGDVPDHQTVHSAMLLDADPGVGIDDDVPRGQDVISPPPDNVSTI